MSKIRHRIVLGLVASSLCLALAACGGTGKTVSGVAGVNGTAGAVAKGAANSTPGAVGAAGSAGSTGSAGSAGSTSANAGSAASANSGTGGAAKSSGASTASAPAGTNATAQPTAVKRWNAPPPMSLQPGKSYSAVVHTNFGSFTIDLFAKQAPHTVNNFVFLARHGYYDGNRFFRIIRTFMVQTGDPTNTGRGGPGYTFKDELPPPFPYAPGIVAMANAGPNTNGSQFFICTGTAAAGLNRTPNYTEFGRVVSGMSVVERIAAIPVKPNPAMGGEMSLPTQNAHMTSVDIVVK